MARGTIKSTDVIIGEILQKTEFPIKKHALLRRVGGVGWDRFDDIIDYMVRENAVETVQIGAEEHIRRNDGNGRADRGVGDEN